MPTYSKEFGPELACLIERQPSTDCEDLTEPYCDWELPAATTNTHDKEECSSSTSTKLLEAIFKCPTSIFNPNCVEPQPLLSNQSLSISSSPPFLATPVVTSACDNPVGISSCGTVDSLRSDSTTPRSDSIICLNDLNRNPLVDHPLIFYHFEKPVDLDLTPDTILHWYGENRKDYAEESLQHDKALVAEYIRSNSKLSAQLAFMNTRRKKKQPDSSLVEDYLLLFPSIWQ